MGCSPWGCEELDKIEQMTYTSGKKREDTKKIKSEMKMEKLQPIPQQYKDHKRLL